MGYRFLKIKGTVKVYCWDSDSGKIRYVAKNGKVTFAAKQLGNFIITTGTT